MTASFKKIITMPASMFVIVHLVCFFVGSAKGFATPPPSTYNHFSRQNVAITTASHGNSIRHHHQQQRQRRVTHYEHPSPIKQSISTRTSSSSSSNNNNNNSSSGSSTTALLMKRTKNDDDKFSFGQRIESLKCVVVGALSGGIALAPFSALHDIALGGDYVQNGLAQWEFDTDMGSLQTALFAIVYRYCVRDDENPMLNQGVIGAFVLVRTLSRVQVPTYCSAAPMDCGPPFGYYDWSMLSQVALSGLESVAMFGAAALAMEYCFSRRIISKFR